MVTSICRPEFSQKAHRLVGLLLIALLMLVLTPASAGAHASLLGTSPADGAQLEESPPEIVLEFSEPVGIVDGGIVLHGSDTDSITLAGSSQGSDVVIPLEQRLDDGAYILQWRVISADSHPVSGTVSFTIGDADPAAVSEIAASTPSWVEWARSIAVAVKYIGLLAALGVLLVGSRLVPTDFSAALSIAQGFAALAFVGILAELPFAAMVQRGMTSADLPELWRAITDLDSGTQLAAVIGAAASVALVVGGKRFRGWLIPVLLMILGVGSLMLSGHTRSQEPIWLMMVSDIAHVLTASVWLGGMLLLTMGLLGRWRGEGFTTPEKSSRAVSRFSTLAGYTAIAVIISGATMALVILDSLNALTDTRYGITLLIKIGLVVVVLLLAAANRFWLLPKRNAGAEESMSWLRRLVSVELVVLLAIAGITGSLVHQNPNVQADAAEEQRQPVVVFDGESSLDSDHVVRLKISSSSSNEVTIIATVVDEERNIVLPDSNLELNWYLPERDLGPLGHKLFLDSSTGAYIGTFSLPASGEWELRVQIRIDRFTDSRTILEIVIPD